MYALAEPVYAPLLEAAPPDLRQLLWTALDNPRPITLRPYQRDAVVSIVGQWERGITATLAALATGVGKTEVGLGAIQTEYDAGRVGRCLWLSHRQELVFQPIERIVRGWPGLPCPGVVMADYDMAQMPLVVATVQTLSVERRLERLLSYGPITHLVVDETHRVTAKSYLRLIERLRDACPDLRILGLTATPKRTDGDGLKRVFQSVAARISIKDAIRLGALVPFMALAVELPISLLDITETGEGWNDEELGDVMSAANALEIIVQTWRKHAENRPTIAFTASVKQAHRLAEAFTEAGIPAAAIDGTTPQGERWDILTRYRSGALKLLANVAVLTEGWDSPATACVLNARPTKSDLTYTQMAGRGLRTAPGKDDCLLLDFCPLDARDMVLAGDLLGKPRKQRKQEERAERLGVILDVFGIDAYGQGIDGDPDSVVVRVLDFLSSHSAMRKLAWVFDGQVASVSTGYGESLALVVPQRDRMERAEAIRASGQWHELWQAEYEHISQYHLYHLADKRARLLCTTEDETEAYAQAEAWAGENAAAWASVRGRKWRNRMPTLKRKRFAVRLGVFQENMSDGECSQAIGHELTLRTLRREGGIR